MEYLTKDSYLSFSETGEGTYTELYGMNSYPKMGGTPQKVDVSNMRDSKKRSINGLQEVDNLDFGFYYNAESKDDSDSMAKKAFSKLKTLEKSNKLVFWRLTFPDDSHYDWQGKPIVNMDGGSVGEAMKFTLSVSLESDLEFTEGTATDETETTSDETETETEG